MGALRGRAGCWALRSGLRPSLQAQQPGLNCKDTTFNLFLPLRVYFYVSSIDGFGIGVCVVGLEAEGVVVAAEV